MKARPKTLSLPLFLSLWLHLTLGLLVTILSLINLNTHKTGLEKKLIEFEIVEEKSLPNSNHKIFVKHVEVPPSVKKKPLQSPNDQALFLSKDTVRFEKQQRAALIGPTQNAPPTPWEKLGHSTSPTPEPKVKAQLGDGDFLSSEDNSEFQLALPPRQSSLSIWVPENIEVGQFTVLNTDRWTYYSFFERIENKVRPIWISRVREAAQQIPETVLRTYPRPVATSILEIQILPSGEVTRILLLRSSGLEWLDQAHSKAFWDAKILENPPKDLIEPDGLIKLRYQFLVILR